MFKLYDELIEMRFFQSLTSEKIIFDSILELNFQISQFLEKCFEYNLQKNYSRVPLTGRTLGTHFVSNSLPGSFSRTDIIHWKFARSNMRTDDFLFPS